MSVCVTIRTTKELSPKQILKQLADHGEKIMLTSEDFPTVKFGTMEEALRGIEINKEDNGYEVRVCAFANKADYRLFSITIDTIMQMSDGRAFLEDDDDSEVLDPLKSFGETWGYEQMDNSAQTLGAMIRHSGTPVVLFGLFSPYCFGPRIAEEFELDLSKPSWYAILDLLDYFTVMQWKTSQIKDTSSQLTIQNPNDSDDNMLNVSLISAHNGKVDDFDYISYADLVGLMDADNDVGILIRIDDLRYILPEDEFYSIDDYQSRRTHLR